MRAYLIGTVGHVNHEQLEIEIFSESRMLVQLWKGHQDVIVNRTVEQAHSDDRQDRPEGIPEQQVRVLENAASEGENPVRKVASYKAHY